MLGIHKKQLLNKLCPSSFQHFQCKWLHSAKAANSPLEGVRVLDLTRIVAGPYCTMILGDLGAEIIKIEKPGSGDEARKWGPPFVNNTNESCYFVAVNRNKKSICVDMKTTEGVEIIHSLAQKCDVLVENFVPGKLDQLQLGFEALHAIAPRLIYCSISGYGPEGPYCHRPGYDVVAASLGGLLHVTGPRNGPPMKVGVAITDITTGLYAHGAIMAALLQRQRTSKGQKIDCNLLSTQVASLINISSNYLNAGKEATKWGTAHESIVPYEAFPTKNDGYYTIGAGSDAQFRQLCRMIQRPDLAENAKYQTNYLRVKNRKELISILKSILITKTNDEWARVFEGSAAFPCGAVNNIESVFEDVHIKHIGLVETLQHSSTGEIRVVGPPVKFSEGGNRVRSPPPTLGQHTDDVLKTILHYDDNKLHRLRMRSVIQ